MAEDLDRLWNETTICPAVMITSYEIAQKMSAELKFELPEDLIPGEPVMFFKGGIRSVMPEEYE